MDFALGHRPGGIGDKLSGADLVHDRFGEDRARRVAGAEKQDVEGFAGIGRHDFVSSYSA